MKIAFGIYHRCLFILLTTLPSDAIDSKALVGRQILPRDGTGENVYLDPSASAPST